MRSRLIALGLLGVVACGRSWRTLQAIEAELACDMTRARVAAIASGHGATLHEGPSNPWGSWHIRIGDGYDNLSLEFEQGKLKAVSAARHQGIKRLCAYPQLNLCSGVKRVPLTVEYDPSLEGRNLLLDGVPRGDLRSNGMTLMVSEGRHRLVARSGKGEEIEQVVDIDIPAGCSEEGPTVRLQHPAAE